MKPALKFYANIKKDTLLLTKRKQYLHLFILLPLIIGTLFIFILQPKNYTLQVGICDLDQTETSKQSIQNINNFEIIPINQKNCEQSLITKIKNGEINLGITIPKDFEKNLKNLKQSKLIVSYDNTDIAFTNLISWKIDQSLEPFEKKIIGTLNSELETKIKSIRSGLDIVLEISDFSNTIQKKIKNTDDQLKTIEEMNTEFLTNPIWTQHKPIYEKNMKKEAGIIYIFPILSLFIILMLSSTSIIYDKKTGFITRLKVSSSPIYYILAKLAFFTTLVAIQFLIIITLFILTGSSYIISPASILHLILFIGIINTSLGLIIGLIANNEGIAVLFSLMISFPLMLISGIFFPTQALPKIIQWISTILPLHYQINATKSALLFGLQFSNTWIYLAIILFLIIYHLIKKN